MLQPHSTAMMEAVSDFSKLSGFWGCWGLGGAWGVAGFGYCRVQDLGIVSVWFKICLDAVT